MLGVCPHYHAVGNRLTQTVLTDTTVFTYDAANRLTSVTPESGGQGYTQAWKRTTG